MPDAPAAEASDPTAQDEITMSYEATLDRYDILHLSSHLLDRS